MLPRDPQVMGVLHGEPALGASADGLGQAQRHFRGDATGSIQHTAQGGGGHPELLRENAAADVVGLKVDAGDELAGVRGVVHAHQ